MTTTQRRFEKQVGDVRSTITEEIIDGRKSRSITFTCRQSDGREAAVFSGEGDLSQLSMVLWQTQDWLKNHPDDIGLTNDIPD